jgi:hypothetical protein
MVRTLDRIYADAWDFRGSELNGYDSFSKESDEIGIGFGNKVKYDSLVSRLVDSFYRKTGKLESLDCKRDEALRRIERLDDLEEKGVKYLEDFKKLDKDYEILKFNSENEVLESKDKLNSFEGVYSDMKYVYDILNKGRLSRFDRIKNSFYSIFNKKKVKAEVECDSASNNRISLKRKMRYMRKDIKLEKKILNRKTNVFNDVCNKYLRVWDEMDRTSDFIKNSEKSRDVYRNYLHNSKEDLFSSKSFFSRCKDYIKSLGIVKDDCSTNFSYSFRNRLDDVKRRKLKSIDRDVVSLFDKKYGVDLDSLTDYVAKPKLNEDVPFEIERRSDFKD